jgi:hypothetical protein
MGRRWTITEFVVPMVVMAVLASCGEDGGDRPTFTGDDLTRGIRLDVRDSTDAVGSAVLFSIEQLPGDARARERTSERLEQEAIAVHDPAGEYAVVIAYRSGGFCGVIPDVNVTGDEDNLNVEITTFDSGDCDAVEYSAAVGLELASNYHDAKVTASRG